MRALFLPAAAVLLLGAAPAVSPAPRHYDPRLARARLAARGGALPSWALEARQAAMDRLSATSTAGTPAWTSIGPTSGSGNGPSPAETDSGRMVSIVVDPTNTHVIYLAVAGGGVWKCSNADPAQDNWAWTPLTDNLTAASSDGSIAPGALAISPVDHLTLYLAMGDPFVIGPASKGVYVTHDGGSTWSRL